MPILAAGGVVYRPWGKNWEVVLVVPVREPNRWALPKGHQDPGETMEATALREVQEETGLMAQIEAPLGHRDYWYVWQGQSVHKQVHYYLMTPIGGSFEHHDHEMSQVVWVPLAEARQRITFATEGEMLTLAQEFLSKKS